MICPEEFSKDTFFFFTIHLRFRLDPFSDDSLGMLIFMSLLGRVTDYEGKVVNIGAFWLRSFSFFLFIAMALCFIAIWMFVRLDVS